MGKKNGSYFWIFGHQTSWLSKVNPDDAENTTSKSHGPWALLMAPAQQQERIFAEYTGVVPTKYPPKIKLELFSLL